MNQETIAHKAAVATRYVVGWSVETHEDSLIYKVIVNLAGRQTIVTSNPLYILHLCPEVSLIIFILWQSPMLVRFLFIKHCHNDYQ